MHWRKHAHDSSVAFKAFNIMDKHKEGKRTWEMIFNLQQGTNTKIYYTIP
jgi:hypothetical protein